MPWITSLTSITTIIPLVAVISLTAIKDVVDDIVSCNSVCKQAFVKSLQFLLRYN